MNSGVFSWEKQARFTYRTFVPECPCEKFMTLELTFLWFGLPGPLLSPDPMVFGPSLEISGHHGIALNKMLSCRLSSNEHAAPTLPALDFWI